MDPKSPRKSSSDTNHKYGNIPILLAIPPQERPTQPLDADATPVPRHTKFEDLVRHSQQSDFSSLIQHVNNLILDSKESTSHSDVSTPRPENLNDSMYNYLRPQPLNTAGKDAALLRPTVYVSPSPRKKVRFEDSEDEGWASDDTVRGGKQFATTPLPRTRRLSHEGSGTFLFDQSPPIRPATPLKPRRTSQNQREDVELDLGGLSLGESDSRNPTVGARPRVHARPRHGGGYYGMAVGYTTEEGRKSGGIYSTKGNEGMFEGGNEKEGEEKRAVVGLGIKGAGLDEKWVDEGGCGHVDCVKRCSKGRKFSF